MCHPAVIVQSTDVSFLPSEEIKGATVLFQLSSGSQSSLYLFTTITATGCRRSAVCIYRGKHSAAWVLFMDNSLGAPELAWPQHNTRPSGVVPVCLGAQAEPFIGIAVPAGVFTVVLLLLSCMLNQPACRTERLVFPWGNLPSISFGK